MKIYWIILCVLLITSCHQEEKKLPFLQQDKNQKIPAFSLRNQDSVVVTERDFNGAIYVADFFFTSCPTICPTMHRNLLKVYQKYKGNPKVKIASHTIDVKYDLPSRMKAYATKLGVKGTQWEFLWGSRDEIYALAERNYLVSAQEDKKAPGGFVHQGYLILVDQQKRIRGAYDGTQDDDVKKLMKDMDILLKE